VRSPFAAIPLLVGCAAATPSDPQRVPPSGHANSFLAIEVTSELAGFQVVGLRVGVDGRTEAAVGVRRGENVADAAPLALPACGHRAMVQAGTHDVSLDLRLRGHGAGVFSYLRSYAFDVRSQTRVDVPIDAFGVTAHAIAHERGGPTIPIEDRPHVRWRMVPNHEGPSAGCHPAH